MAFIVVKCANVQNNIDRTVIEARNGCLSDLIESIRCANHDSKVRLAIDDRRKKNDFSQLQTVLFFQTHFDSTQALQ